MLQNTEIVDKSVLQKLVAIFYFVSSENVNFYATNIYFFVFILLLYVM